MGCALGTRVWAGSSRRSALAGLLAQVWGGDWAAASGWAAGVGLVFAALGIGGLVGSVVAVRLVGQQRMASWFGVGLMLWGLPLLILALQPALPVAVALLATVGVGNLIGDVAGFSIL